MRLPLDTSLAEATAGISCLVAALAVFLYYVTHPRVQAPRIPRRRIADAEPHHNED